MCSVELYETVEQVGASMKQYVVEGMRNMWQQLNELARSHRGTEQQPSREEPDTPTSRSPLTLYSNDVLCSPRGCDACGGGARGGPAEWRSSY